MSRPRANAPPPSFDVSDNARLALENKQAEVDALRAKLSAAEDALKARDARQKDLERRLARHEGDAVMQEAASLNDMMTNAIRDVRGFFSRAGSAPSATPPANADDADASPLAWLDGDDDGAGGVPVRRRETSPEESVDGEPRGARASALKPRSRSMLSRSTTGGDRTRDGSASASTLADETKPKPKSKSRVAFVDDSEQARLIKEGDYVAALAASRRKCAELAETLAAREASLESTRRRAETTKASLTAASAKLEDEIARRKRAESRLELAKFGARDGGDGDDEDGETQTLRRTLTRARDIVRDALGAAASAASAGVPVGIRRDDAFFRFDAAAATAAAALPALAALAHAKTLADGRERPGRVARDMLALGAANAATEAMAAYPRDAAVATRACELLAALARGAAADGSKDARDAAANVAVASAASSIVHALREHRSDGDACAWGAEATGALAEAGGAKAARAFAEAGAAEALADAARWHPSDEDVVGAVARAVARLAAADASVEDALERSGAAEIARESSRAANGPGANGRVDGTGARSVGRGRSVEGASDSNGRERSSDDRARRSRAAIPEEREYVGSGLKPKRGDPRDARGGGGGGGGDGGDANGETSWLDDVAANGEDFDDML